MYFLSTFISNLFCHLGLKNSIQRDFYEITSFFLKGISMKKLFLLLFPILALTACTGIPDGVTPVKNFNAEKYVGTWYEVARLDHRFERGLTKVTATYSLLEDGGIKVVNRGFNPEKKEWTEAEGKAYFVNGPDLAYLKVTFFWPFYGSYVIFELDQENYQYALVSGPDKSYLWLLSRTPTLDQATKAKLINRAKATGFDVSQLITVEH